MNESALDTVALATEDTLTESALDSTFLTAVEKPVVSLFSDHLLETDTLEPLSRLDISNEFVFVLLSICAFLIIFLQRNSDGIFSTIIRSSFDSNLAAQESRVDNSQRTRNILILQFISAISISVFVSGVILWSNPTLDSFAPIFGQVFGGLLLFVILKRGLQWALANLFQLSNVLKSFHFNVNVLWSFAGLLALPLCLLLFYSPIIPTTYLTVVGTVIFLLFYLKVLQRGVRISLYSGSVSPLHLFYYFCALEMLPLFVLIRVAFLLQ
ncbi:MAG: DUF4271 domain-containing protein [Flavobacteriales bacterium]|nr:DUF4271 domain-containing protein [Flavobacteriales bacterium]MCB9191669.1 DUF4271 domain-containing protein [Flavobacteriales bacterium]MCB9203677.1 DUF4271 domain-containing protein [Flavobacteriales bacterium]